MPQTIITKEELIELITQGNKEELHRLCRNGCLCLSEGQKVNILQLISIFAPTELFKELFVAVKPSKELTRNCLISAASYGKLETFNFILTQKYAKTQKYLDEALLYAAIELDEYKIKEVSPDIDYSIHQLRKQEIVKILIENGVNPFKKDETKSNILHIIAPFQGNNHIMQAILENAEYQPKDLDIPNKKGNSALTLALKYSNQGVVALLLEHGASQKELDIVTALTEGQSMLNVAMLVARGARPPESLPEDININLGTREVGLILHNPLLAQDFVESKAPAAKPLRRSFSYRIAQSTEQDWQLPPVAITRVRGAKKVAASKPERVNSK